MYMQRLTRRQRYTINMLQETYVDLLQDYPAEKITIVQLCERADINRSTFYRYYLDLKDLKDQTAEYLFHQIFEILNTRIQANSKTATDMILHALDVTINNQKLCRHLLCRDHTNLATQVLEEHLLIFKETTLSTGCTETEAQLCYGFLCGGLANLWIKWIESDFTVSREKMALIIEQIILSYYNMLENGFLLQNP